MLCTVDLVHILEDLFEVFFSFFKDFIYFFLERGEGMEKEGEKHQCVGDTSISCLSHTPNWGPGLQPRHVP